MPPGRRRYESRSLGRDFVERRKLLMAFVNAAKLILLVDVRGEMTFAAENGVRDDSDYMRGGRLPSVDSGERLGVWRRGGRGRIRERGPQPQI
jgi:hypothetical protein